MGHGLIDSIRNVCVFHVCVSIQYRLQKLLTVTNSDQTNIFPVLIEIRSKIQHSIFTCTIFPQNDSGRGMINGAMRSHREIVTTRTPLLAAHQESCV